MLFTNHSRNGWRFLWLLVTLLGCQTFIACQSKPQDVAATLKQCQGLLDKDDLIAANDCYGKAIIKYPQSAVEISKKGETVFFKKCVDLEKRERYEQAIVCFEGMTILSPDKSSIYIHLAENYYKYYKTAKDKTDDSLARAEEAIKKAIELRAESAIAHNTYGRISEEMGNYQNALKEHRHAVELEPNVPVYLTDLALLQEKLEDFSGALESYQSALKINPDDTDVLYFLAGLYEKTGRIDKTIETIEKRISIEPAKKETLDKLNFLKQKLKTEQQNKNSTKSKTKLSGS